MAWTQFGTETAATGGQLDGNFTIVGYNGTLPCTIAGINTLALTLSVSNPTVTAYQNYQRFAGIAAQTNSSSVTAQVGSLAALSVYKDTGSGPIALTGNEIIANNYIVLIYDSALNTGSGGFHLTDPQTAGTVQSIVAGKNLTGSTITVGGTIALSGTVSSINMIASTVSGVSIGPSTIGTVTVASTFTGTLSGIPIFAGASIAAAASIGTVTVSGVYAGFMLTTINGAAYKLGLFNV